MAAEMKVEGMEQISEMLTKLGEQAESVAALGLYDGAGVMADAVNQAAGSIKTEAFKYSVFGQRLPSPEEAAAVQKGAGVAKFEKKEERVTRRGAGQSVVVDASTVELERLSDKRVISVKLGVHPISVEEQMDLQWDRGEGKKLTLAKGSEFTLANRKYKVKSLKKGHVTIVDLKSNTEKTIGDGASEPKSAAKPAPNPKPSPKR